ncbi:MAG: PLP-dependent aminotransferase family protein [Lachnospiraceae bacterium]|nr:PLP-dependent aminotransferase family protein [Lachnospiraceae bacterium]
MPVNSFDSYPLTWKPQKEKLRPPYYKALAGDLEDKIRSGLLKEGTKLPPQREIADYLDLNYTTITRVYDLCKKKGLIYGTMGKGTFVSPHSAEDITIPAPQTLDVCIEMGAVNGFGEYSGLIGQATHRVIEKGYLRNLYEYSYPAGHPHQLAAGIRWMEQLGAHADCEHTAIFAGAQNALAVAFLALFSPGDKIAADEYTYSNFIELAKLLHLVLIPVRGDEKGMLPEELQKQCTVNRIKGIYLIPTCANPTAVSIPAGRRSELAAVIRRNDLILVEDDISAWLHAAGGKVLPSMFDTLGGQSIYICGMTKSLCPGLRIAYMAFGERYKAAILHGLLNVNIKTSSFDAEIITELILNGDAYQIAAKKRMWTEKNCLLYAGYFPDFYDERKAVSYYQWLPIEVPGSFYEVENELLNRGVRVYHSGRFAVAEGSKQNFLRVSLCSAGSTKKLERGLQILREYLEEGQ